MSTMQFTMNQPSEMPWLKNATITGIMQTVYMIKKTWASGRAP